MKNKLLDFVYKGDGIIRYKRSYQHPLLGKDFYNDRYGFFKVSKVWNIKRYVPNCEFNYEKDPHIVWDWKVEIIKDSGIYIINLSDLFLGTGLFTRENEKVSDENMFIFYK